MFERIKKFMQMKPTDDAYRDAKIVAYMLFYCHKFYEDVERVQRWEKAQLDDEYLQEKLFVMIHDINERIKELWYDQFRKNIEYVSNHETLKDETYMNIV